MAEFFEQVFKWSEVWPFLIPLTIFVFYSSELKGARYIIIYLLIAFSLSLFANIIQFYNPSMPGFLKDNNIYYNILSIVKTLLIGIYVIRLKQMKQYPYLSWLLVTYCMAVSIYFIFYEDIFVFSSLLVSIECIVLLIICLTYFLGSIVDEEVEISIKDPAFLICAAISIYEAINFYIFLFFAPILSTNLDFGYLTMKISKISNIMIGILFGVALYRSRSKLFQEKDLIIS